MSNTLRDLALKAKNRLKAISAQNFISGGEKEYDQEKSYSEACLSARLNYAIIANNNKIEGDPLYSKIKKMLQKDEDPLNPIYSLIDHKIYDQLSQTEKEKYILKLTKRFSAIKNYIISNLTEDNILN